ncbi:MAG: LytTR family transcriptional regulator DNA-binding domain-containing protein [Merdibacter sp.]
MEKALGQRYVRIHRRYLVNRAYIQEWNDAEDTVLVHGTTLHFPAVCAGTCLRGGCICPYQRSCSPTSRARSLPTF